MDGETALKYVRSRHSAQDGSDFGRAARQRNVILAVRDKVFRLDFFPKIIPFVSSLTDDLKTDFALADMQNFLKYKDELSEYRITSTALSNDNVLAIGRSPDGQSIVTSQEGVGNWNLVHSWVQTELNALRNPQPASQSATATNSAQQLSN
jgi:anionic cell wall polymer biosynthesis LytR-Cps2A-Psr (LCP) family protein